MVVIQPIRCGEQKRAGALVSPDHLDKVKSYPDYASAGNLDIVYGGDTQNDAFVQLTVVDGVDRDRRLLQEEIFGTVLSVTTIRLAR